MFDTVALGRLIKKTRGDLRISQEVLAQDALGSPDRKADISRLENARVDNPQEYTIRRIADALGLTEEQIDTCRTDPDHRPSRDMVDRLVAEKEALAQKLDLRRSLVMSLAYRMADTQAQDFDGALNALEAALETASRLIKGGQDGSNVDDFVDDVLKRIADRVADEDFTGAATVASDATAQATAGLSRLLQAEADAHLLAQDPTAAASALIRMHHLDHSDPDALIEALRAEQDKWYVEGRDKGIDLRLALAEQISAQTLPLCQTPDQRGAVLNNHGNVLKYLGERRGDESVLEHSAEAYRAALEEGTRERVPLNWAGTQNNLGNTLRVLGQRRGDETVLEQAVAAYRAALEEWTRERVPLDWAMTQNNLGITLQVLGERRGDETVLEQSAAAFRAALEERTRERVPLDWAMTQNNLGITLQILGQRRGDEAVLEQAAAAYRAALEERTRERVPLDWAMTQNNLGITLQVLGERRGDEAVLEQAAAAYRAALEERTRERVPLDWAATQTNLANLQGALCEITGNRAHIKTGLAHIKDAIKVFEKHGAKGYLEIAHNVKADLEAL